jgi:hypothetical protein
MHRTAGLRGIVIVAALLGAGAMGIAAAFPDAGEVAVAVAFAGAFLFSLAVSRQAQAPRRADDRRKIVVTTETSERIYEREPVGAPR